MAAIDNGEIIVETEEEQAPVGPPPGPVLFAVDQSDESEMAFDWYIGTFHRPERLGLVVYHVVDQPPARVVHGHADVYMGGAEWQQIIDQQKVQAKKLEQHYKEKLAKLKLAGRVKIIYYARPGEAISEAAAKEGACVIVMGARGTSTTRKTIIGSTTDFVIKHAHCPVTTYRYNPQRRNSLAKDDGARRGSFSKLLSRLGSVSDKPRSRSNSFEVRRSYNSSRSNSVNNSRDNSRSASPVPTDTVDGTYRKSQH